MIKNTTEIYTISMYEKEIKTEATLNYDLKTIIKILVGYFSILLFSVIVHEFSHIIVALVTGNTINSVYFGINTSNGIQDFFIAISINYVNENSIGVILISGSIGSSIFALILMLLSLRKLNLTVYTASFVILIFESFYWSLSYVLGHGDCYLFFNHVSYDNPTVILGFFTVLFVSLIIICLVSYVKLIDKKLARKETQKEKNWLNSITRRSMKKYEKRK